MSLILDDQISINAADQILAEIEKILVEMRHLAVFSANTNLSKIQREKVQSRIDSLKKEVDSVAAMLAPPDGILH